jgi:hypothetical protein
MSLTHTNISSPPHQHAVTAPLPINVLPTMSPTHTTTTSPHNPHAATTSLPPSNRMITRSQTQHAATSSQTQHIATSPSNRMVTRSQIGHLKPKHFPGYKMFYTPQYPLLSLQAIHLPSTPTTYKQAAANPQWIEAMTSEYNALLSNQT